MVYRTDLLKKRRKRLEELPLVKPIPQGEVKFTPVEPIEPLPVPKPALPEAYVFDYGKNQFVPATTAQLAQREKSYEIFPDVAPGKFSPQQAQDQLLKRLYPDINLNLDQVKTNLTENQENFLTDLFQRNAPDQEIRQLFALVGVGEEGINNVLTIFKKARIDQQREDQIFTSVFPDRTKDEVIQQATENPDQFLNEIKQVGKTPDTEDLLIHLGFTADEANTMLAPPLTEEPVEAPPAEQPTEIPVGAEVKARGVTISPTKKPANIWFLGKETSIPDLITRLRESRLPDWLNKLIPDWSGGSLIPKVGISAPSRSVGMGIAATSETALNVAFALPLKWAGAVEILRGMKTAEKLALAKAAGLSGRPARIAIEDLSQKELAALSEQLVKQGKLVLPTQISMDEAAKLESMRAEQRLYEAQQELEGLKDWLVTDPIANYRIKIPVLQRTVEVGGVKKQVGKGFRESDLTAIIGMKEGEVPEYFTLNQAKQIRPNTDFFPIKEGRNAGKVPRDAVLGEIADKNGISPDELAEKINQIRVNRARINQLESEVAAGAYIPPEATTPIPEAKTTTTSLEAVAGQGVEAPLVKEVLTAVTEGGVPQVKAPDKGLQNMREALSPEIAKLRPEIDLSVPPPSRPPRPPQTVNTPEPLPVEPSRSEITRIIKQSEEVVRQDRPGAIKRFALKIPGVKQLLEFERPGLKMTGENEKVLTAMVAENAAKSDVSVVATANRYSILKDLRTQFGKDAIRGGKTDIKFLGTAEQSKNPITGTLKDIADNPELYALADNQKGALAILEARNDQLLEWVTDKYGAEIGRFTAKPDGAFLPNVDIADDVLEYLGSEFRAVASGRGKTRIWNTARERMAAHPDFKPELDVQKLIEGLDTFKANSAAGQTYREAIGGLTKAEVIQKTHPALYAKWESLHKQVNSLKGSAGTIESNIHKAIYDFEHSPIEGADLTQLRDALDVSLKAGPRKGMDTVAIQNEITKVRDAIAELKPAWEAANLKPYTFVQEGIFRYFPSKQANLIKESRQVTNNRLLDVIEKWRGQAFSGDFSPFAIQGSVGVLADPIGSLKAGIGGVEKAIATRDMLRSVKIEALADDISHSPQEWAQFASLMGRGLTGTPSEYAAGFLSKIPGFDKFTEATYVTVTRGAFNSWKRNAAQMIKAGVPELEARVAAANLASEVFPLANAARLGQSQARAAVIRAMPTSYSFIRQPVSVVAQASEGFAKLAIRKPLTPQESLAVKTVATLAATTLGVSATSAAISAKAQGKSDDEILQAVKDAINPDPHNGRFLSIIIGDKRIPIGGPYRALVRAIMPQEVEGSPVPIPFAGAFDFLKNRITPAIRTQLELIQNRDYAGTQIVKGNFPENILRGLAYEFEGALPLTAGTVIEAARQGERFKENVSEQALAQFLGVNLVTLDNTYLDRQERLLGLPKPLEYTEPKPNSIQKPEVYDTKDYWGDAGKVLKNIEPGKLGSAFKAKAKAIAETRVLKEQTDTMLNKKITAINADPSKGDTFMEYYQQWQDRAKDPEAYDKKYPDNKAKEGNFSQRQLVLIQKYNMLSPTDTKGREQFLRDNPEISINPREDYLKSHPDENAQLAIWGQAGIYSTKAFDRVQALAKELDIPDSALPDLKYNGVLVPADPDLRKSFFEYQETVDKFKSDSPEAHLMLAQNDALREHLGLKTPITTPIPALEIGVKNRALNDKYDALTSEKDKAAFLEANPKYADDKTRISAYKKQYAYDNTVADKKVIESFVEYDKTGAGNEKTLYRIDHPDFEDVWSKVEGWKPLDIKSVDALRLKVKNKETEKIISDLTGDADKAWFVNPANKDAALTHFKIQGFENGIAPDEIEAYALKEYKDKVYSSLDATGKADYLKSDPVYALQVTTEKGRNAHVPENYLPTYVQFEQTPTEGQVRERLLQANPNYYNDVYLGILGHKPVDFTKVASEKFETMYRDVYSKEATDKEKDLFRYLNPDFEKEGLAIGKFTSPVQVKSVLAQRLSIANQAMDEQYKRIIEPAKQRLFLTQHPDYAVNRIKITGLNDGVPEPHINTYVAWKINPMSSYALERFMASHLSFYRDVYKKILGNKALDFRNILPESLDVQLNTYSDLRGTKKTDYLKSHSALRKWLEKRAKLQPSKATDFQ